MKHHLLLASLALAGCTAVSPLVFAQGGSGNDAPSNVNPTGIAGARGQDVQTGRKSAQPNQYRGSKTKPQYRSPDAQSGTGVGTSASIGTAETKGIIGSAGTAESTANVDTPNSRR